MAAALATAVWLRVGETWTHLQANSSATRQIATSIEWIDSDGAFLMGTVSGALDLVSATGTKLSSLGMDGLGSTVAVHASKSVGVGDRSCRVLASSEARPQKAAAQFYMIAAFSGGSTGLSPVNTDALSPTCARYPSNLAQFAIDEFGQLLYVLPAVTGNSGAVAVTQLSDGKTVQLGGGNGQVSSPITRLVGLRDGVIVGRESGEVDLFESAPRDQKQRRVLRNFGPGAPSASADVADRIEHLSAARGTTFKTPLFAYASASGRLFFQGKESSEADRVSFDSDEAVLLYRHTGVVNYSSFSPNGKRIVTASFDESARVWESGTGRELLALVGHEASVNSAAFSPDGTRIVTASSDKTARIWDAASGREIAALQGHEDSVNSAAFSPDGTRIVTASSDKTARIWDAASGREIAALQGHEDSVNSAAFSPDGTRIVTASSDKTARIWDAASGREIAALQGHEDSVNSAAFSPDGTRIVTASSDKTARIWDAALGREIAALRGHEASVNSAAFSPDGTRIVTASSDKTARIWDAGSGYAIVKLADRKAAAQSASFSPDGMRIVTSSGDNARVSNAEFASARAFSSLANLELSNDGATLLLRRLGGSTALMRSIEKSKRSPNDPAPTWDLRTVGLGPSLRIVDAALSPDGSTLALAVTDNSIRMFDVSALFSDNGGAKEIAEIRGHSELQSAMSFSDDGDKLAISDFNGDLSITRLSFARMVWMLEMPSRTAFRMAHFWK